MENNFIDGEHKILEFWKERRVFEKLKEKNKRGKLWSFLDGPITANNPMGVHHAWGRSLKDLFQKFKAMQGFSQRFQNGFDCQGLWVEVEVEKELGFKSKKDIEIYGIENFVNKCKERVLKYSKIQTEQSIRLGMQSDWEHSYYTMSDENNYAIWHFLKKCKEKGLLYKGRDSVPWCPRCGTAISQHEILQEEYKELTHKAVYVKFPVVGPASSAGRQPNTYFLAWTTTPWTLPGNVALAVNPDLEYAVVNEKLKTKNEKPQSKIQNAEKIILLRDKVSLLDGDYEIEETIKGRDLAGWEYEGLFDEMEAVKNALGDYKHRVVLWKDITAEEGTGIVHIAPGCGQEDFQLAKTEDLPVIDLTDNESNYREGFGELAGKFVGSEGVRQWIFDDLEKKGLIFKIEDYTHRYPICWRCKTELIFRVVDEWYISMDKLREPLIKAVEKINWLPSFCKERELDWLKNMHDWLISKKRYWGLALPIWECECGNFEVIGGKEALEKRAVEGFDKFSGQSPHRPWLDAVKIKCSKCGALVSRILDVGTPWLDAGIVPFSTISDDNRSENIPYFHNKRKEWEKWFPAELVCEGFPGQFKNWFYVLLVMSQVLEGKPPFKNLLGFANVVDEKGEEMHKSKGNAIWFDEGVEKIGADAMRWMYATQNPANNMRFGYNAAKEVQRKILTLTNCVKFFETYISNEKIKMKNEKPQSKIKNLLDEWIISRLNNLIKTATESLEKFDSTKASLAIEDFWINDLSLWFVRRSRKRFQNPENEQEKQEAEQVLHYTLLTLAKLVAPIMPFLAEEIYQGLKTDNMPESVHLCDWPKADKKAIDEQLEEQMAEARRLVGLALAKRAEAGIGVRQALAKLKIKNEKLKTTIKNEKILELIKEEVNVKEIKFVDGLEGEVELDTMITDELKEEGIARELTRKVNDARKQESFVPGEKKQGIYRSDSDYLNNILAKPEIRTVILNITSTTIMSEQEARDGGAVATGEEKEIKTSEGVVWLRLE